MKLLAIGLVFFGMTSSAWAAGLNCKSEAAGHALSQMAWEIQQAGKDLSDYKLNVGRPKTDDVIEMVNGDVKEIYIVPINIYKGHADIELPFDRTVQVEILNTRLGECLVLQVHHSDGE